MPSEKTGEIEFPLIFFLPSFAGRSVDIRGFGHFLSNLDHFADLANDSAIGEAHYESGKNQDHDEKVDLLQQLLVVH